MRSNVKNAPLYENKVLKHLQAANNFVPLQTYLLVLAC